ncbi:MAG: TonB-dependent receptor [Bacteroidales bacterium]|nr:TonB-dependent receptor [Bacteroidales bacterium]
MRGFLFLAALSALIPFSVQGAEKEAADEKVEKLDSVVVSASRAGRDTPMTYTMVGKEELTRSNPLNSLPMNLALQPSVVSVNEGGTGLGYSKMTVRGAKGSQINVTLNGITLNDAESQEVFWVNIPALSSMISSVQLQRGLGTSANGAGAFGASINMSTASVGADPFASAELSVGSYGTVVSTYAAGTGLMKSGLYFNAAYSHGLTDGYIRNAFSDVQSAMAVLGWMKENNSIRLTWLMGDQRTGITWEGISLEQYETDRRYNPAGEYYDQFGNVHYYDNETDNYTQHHFQLNYTHSFSDRLAWSTTFNYTRGDGYYENYKAGKSFSKYLMISPVIDGVTYDEGDFITKEALANDYYVLNSDLRYRTDRLNLTAGVNVSRYDGDHIGSVLWNDVLGDSFDYSSHDWYLNRGLKHEANAFVRGEMLFAENLTAFADLQYRGVWLEMSGPEDDGVLLDHKDDWQFFNPRAGLSYRMNSASRIYASAALGHREPGRSDIKELILDANKAMEAGVQGRGVDIRPEKMLDIEAGYEYLSENLSLSANLYLMEYWDMLIETGKLTDVGYAIKENVPRSWRRGVELAAAWKALPWLQVGGNITLSTNKIKSYTAYYEMYDNMDDWNYLGQHHVDFENTDILMSPSLVGMANVTFRPFVNSSKSWNSTYLSWNGKYVGRQYYDNTSSTDRTIPAYFVADLSAGYEVPLNCQQERGNGSLSFSFHVNNLFNRMYYADAWLWRAYFQQENDYYSEVGIYPQAPVNFMFKVALRF